MKKVMFLLAVAGMFAFAACNNAAPAEEPADSIEQVVAEPATEEVADSLTATDEEVAATEGIAEEATEAAE